MNTTTTAETAVWGSLPAELEPQISAARKILADLQGAKSMSAVRGFSASHRNQLISQALNKPVPKTGDEFLARLEELKVVASVPVGAYILHGQFLTSFLARFCPAYQGILTSALAFLEPRLDEPGVSSVVARLRASLGQVGQAIFEKRFESALRWHCLSELFSEDAAPLEKFWSETVALNAVS